MSFGNANEGLTALVPEISGTALNLFYDAGTDNEIAEFLIIGSFLRPAFDQAIGLF